MLPWEQEARLVDWFATNVILQYSFVYYICCPEEKSAVEIIADVSDPCLVPSRALTIDKYTSLYHKCATIRLQRLFNGQSSFPKIVFETGKLECIVRFG